MGGGYLGQQRPTHIWRKGGSWPAGANTDMAGGDLGQQGPTQIWGGGSWPAGANTDMVGKEDLG